MLTVVQATEGQIKKIEDKYFSSMSKLLQKSSCSYDDEDKIYFITVARPLSTMSFQMRRSGTTPMFFGLTKGGVRYEVSYPEGKLFKYLKQIGEKTIADWKDGSEL